MRQKQTHAHAGWVGKQILWLTHLSDPAALTALSHDDDFVVVKAELLSGGEAAGDGDDGG